MSVSALAVDILLGVAVATSVACVIGLLAMGDVYERLHYLAPVASVSAPCIALALLLAEGIGQAAIKAILVSLILSIVNPVVTHAVARAARVRAYGHWAARPEQQPARPGRRVAAGGSRG